MTPKRGYQLHLSRGDFVLKDVKGRTQKFEKIISVLQHFNPGTQSLICLDIGCSSGIITSLLGNHFQMSIGMDIDQEAIQYAQDHSASTRVQFLMADSMALPFHDNSVDVIVCNHIYEHVPYANQMMDEVYRVLKEGGFCYFSAGNKYMVIEGDHGLPLLSWVPKSFAHLYLKMTGKVSFYYEEHLSLRGLKKLVKKFRVHDYTLPIIQDPENFFATDLFNPKSFLYKCIRLLAPYLYPWIPTYIWVLTKK
ncbi:MAG TPA: class I SAM-dependent methyltransferase [Thermodesulfobacteriota bacterium]|nr:class I SAM-dependent methyltransferase [Thermodesulfobacteriota bacterium]